MKRLFNNRWFVIALAAGALLLLARAIATPLLERPDFSDVPSPAFYPDDLPVGSEPVTPEREAPGTGSVLGGRLAWDETPGRDPFSPPGALSTTLPSVRAAADEPPLPRLDALVAGPLSLLAVLDGRIVREGEHIGAYRVAQIGRDGVRIDTANRSIWLKLAERNTPIGPADSKN